MPRRKVWTKYLRKKIRTPPKAIKETTGRAKMENAWDTIKTKKERTCVGGQSQKQLGVSGGGEVLNKGRRTVQWGPRCTKFSS